MLALADIVATLGARTALRTVSAAFTPGRVTALLGPNGAGKTTLLRVAAGLLTPTAGTVTLDGVALAAMAPRRRAQRIGYLPQGADSAWAVPVERVVALGRLPHLLPFRAPGPADQRAIDAAIAACALTDLRQRSIAELSGGERARCMLARVLAGEPEIVLADEPAAGLDLHHALAAMELLAGLARDGRTVVVVLHDLWLARQFADHVLVLDGGQVVAAGPPAAALDEALLARVWRVRPQAGRAGLPALERIP